LYPVTVTYFKHSLVRPFALVVSVFGGVGGYFGGLTIGQKFGIGVYVGDDVEDFVGGEVERARGSQFGGLGGEEGTVLGKRGGLW